MAKIKTVKKYNITRNELLALSQEATMSRLNCHNIGKIVDFDANTQTCTIELMQLKQFADEVIIPAPLTEVPLIIYGCGDASITLPNPVGATCLVLFLDRNIDAFLQTGEYYVPDTARMHDFTDCVALTSFRTLVNPIENYDENSISINYQQLVSDILYFATIKNFGGSINLKVATETTSAEINIADRIRVQNTAQNLLLVITALIEAIKSLTITNGVVSQASKDALDQIITQFGELLE